MIISSSTCVKFSVHYCRLIGVKSLPPAFERGLLIHVAVKQDGRSIGNRAFDLDEEEGGAARVVKEVIFETF